MKQSEIMSRNISQQTQVYEVSISIDRNLQICRILRMLCHLLRKKNDRLWHACMLSIKNIETWKHLLDISADQKIQIITLYE